MTREKGTMVAADSPQGIAHILAALQLGVGRLVLLHHRSQDRCADPAERRVFLESRGIELEYRTVALDGPFGRLVHELSDLAAQDPSQCILWNTTYGSEAFRHACSAIGQLCAPEEKTHKLCWVEGNRLEQVWCESGTWHQEKMPFGMALSFQEFLACSQEPDMDLAIRGSLPQDPRSPEEVLAEWPCGHSPEKRAPDPLASLRPVFHRLVVDRLAGLTFPVRHPKPHQHLAQAQKILADWLPRALVAVRGAPGLPIGRCVRSTRVRVALLNWLSSRSEDPVAVLLDVVEKALAHHGVPRAEQIMAHLRASASKAHEALESFLVELGERQAADDNLKHFQTLLRGAIEDFLHEFPAVARSAASMAVMSDPTALWEHLQFPLRLRSRLLGSGFKSSAAAARWAWRVLSLHLSGPWGARNRWKRPEKMPQTPVLVLQELVAAYLEHLDPKGVVFVDEAGEATLELWDGPFVKVAALLVTRTGHFIALDNKWPGNPANPSMADVSIPSQVDWALVFHEDTIRRSHRIRDVLKTCSGPKILAVPADPAAVWKERIQIAAPSHRRNVPTLFGFLAKFVRKFRPRPGAPQRSMVHSR